MGLDPSEFFVLWIQLPRLAKTSGRVYLPSSICTLKEASYFMAWSPVLLLRLSAKNWLAVHQLRSSTAKFP